MNKLDTYKKDLKKRRSLYQTYIVLAFLFVMFGNLMLREKIQGQDESMGFAIGLASGLEILLIYKVLKIEKALKDQKILKEMYILENDEREKAIKLRSGAPLIAMMSLSIFVVAILAGFISHTVFITLLVVGLCQSLLALGLKMYWKKKI